MKTEILIKKLSQHITFPGTCEEGNLNIQFVC